MLDFKSFRVTGYVLADVELMHLNREGQFLINGVAMSLAKQVIRWQDKSV